MRSFHESGHFSAVAVDLFRKAQRIVDLIRDPEPGEDPWRCHEVARVVGGELGLAVVDGYYGCVDHSWLVIPNGGVDGHAILDVYGAGVLPQVFLLDTFYGLPAGTSYRVRREPRDDIKHEAVRQMRASLKKTEAAYAG